MKVANTARELWYTLYIIDDANHDSASPVAQSARRHPAQYSGHLCVFSIPLVFRIYYVYEGCKFLLASLLL